MTLRHFIFNEAYTFSHEMHVRGVKTSFVFTKSTKKIVLNRVVQQN